MYILILGVLVIAGCLAYIYAVTHKDSFVSKRPNKDMYEDIYEEEEEETPSAVIYLPDDIEQEKEKRKNRR